MLRLRTVIPAFTRYIIVAVIAILVAFGSGIVTARAEILYNRYVPGAGNVGTAGTYGWEDGGDVYGYGISTSSVTLYYIHAGARIWHYGEIDTQDGAVWYWGTGGSTDTIISSVYGAIVGTRSAFRYSPSSGSSVYYTSWPSYTGSCSNYWYSGGSC